MREQNKKIKAWQMLSVIIPVLGIGLWWSQTSTLLRAEQETSTGGNEVAPAKEAETQSLSKLGRALTAISNERGLSATPRILTVNQNGSFPTAGTSTTELQKLVTNLSIPTPSTGITWEYVDIDGKSITPNSTNVGFQTVYIKITEKTGSSSIQVPIPVNVINSNAVSLFSGQVRLVSDSSVIIPVDQMTGKTEEERKDVIRKIANVSAWNTETGEILPVEVTSAALDGSLGYKNFIFSVELGGKTEQTSKYMITFGATVKSPYYFTVAQGTTFNIGTSGDNLFDKYQSSAGAVAGNATYKWVADKEGTDTVPANTFDTSKTGFKMGYIKMTDKATAVSTIIPIPITITDDSSIVDTTDKFGYNFTKNLNVLKKSEISGVKDSELIETITNNLGPEAWDAVTGEKLPIKITNLNGLTSDSLIGSYQISLTITLANNTQKNVSLPIALLSDSVFPDSVDGWTSIPLNAKDGYIENPINKSKLGFNKRGLTVGNLSSHYGFIIKDSSNLTYTFGESLVSNIPFVNGKLVYPVNSSSDSNNSAERSMGIGRGSNPQFTQQFFLKKGKELKEILIDTDKKLIYVYDLGISRNLNFSVNLTTYNADSETKTIGMLENVDTYYGSDTVPLYSSGNNSGFYMRASSTKRFSIKLKDGKGNYLSAYTMQAPGAFRASSQYPKAANNLYDSNWFRSDFSRPGIEQYNLKRDEVIISGIDTAYQLGAPHTPVASNQALKTGYEVFAGTELPYMIITADPPEWNVYPDYKDNEFKTNYNLSQIPDVGGNGTLYVEYPNGQKAELPFVANDTKQFNGELTIPRATLPDKLNEETGTIKQYVTNLLAIYEKESTMEGLTSEEYNLTVNVYNLGGTPIAQTVKQGTAWSKSAADLIKDPVILPGHKAAFEFVDGQPDTSKIGLQVVKIRMTDSDEPTQTTIIEVPINVIEGTVPTTGLTVAANDFSVSKGKVSGLSEADIKAMILKESKVKAWDNTTGLSTGITVSVITTDLTADSTVGQQYKATIRGTKDNLTSDTTITITVGKPLSAEAVTQTIPLGSDEQYWTADRLQQTVKNVMDGDNEVSNYKVNLFTPPITSRVTDNEAMLVEVVDEADSSQTVKVEIPIKVSWGNAITLGGSETDVSKSGQSTLALTLHEDDKNKPYLRSAYGNLPSLNEQMPLASNDPNVPFYQFTYLNMSNQATGQSNAKEVNDGPNAVNDVTIQGLGSQTPAQLVDQLGTNGKLSVNYGDVLKVYVKQGQHALYTNNQGPAQPLADLPNNETIFVLVTKDGFKPLYFNQLTPKEVSIASESTSTTALYDAHYNSLAAYFTTSGSSSNYTQIKPNGFKTYPKLNLAVGESDNGRVLVAEPTSTTSNQYVTYAYDTTFVGTGPELQIVSPLSSLSFGSQTIKSQTQEIKRTDPNWGFTVLDSRQTKAAWVIQAKMSEPFKTSGANSKQLKGAELKLKQASGTISLNSGYQTIYTKENPGASNNVTWSAEQGFFLQVPPGVIDKDAVYSTDVEFILTSAP